MNDQTAATMCTRRTISNAPIHIFRLFALVLPLLALAMSPLQVTKVAAADDTERGKQLFEKRCTGCHSLDQDKEGPRLRQVYGQKAGSVANFGYSPALKASHVIWDEQSLGKWLADPDSIIPDNDMAFRVPSAEERTEIIRFLRASAGK